VSTDHDPLTDAELDQLTALDAARTPGRLRLRSFPPWGDLEVHADSAVVALIREPRTADARAIVAALNALAPLLAEVRASRVAAVKRAAMQPCCDDYREQT